jgi:Heterokaryon incompatibility protein (HET)
LKCTLKYVSLGSNTDFEALSYTWGAAGPGQTISLDGRGFQVLENLEAALRRLRKPLTQRAVWIDAICINQNDLDERREQVLLMRKIYEQAKQVVVWQGEVSGGGRIGMLCLTGLYSLTRNVQAWKLNRQLGHPIRLNFTSSVEVQALASLNWEQEMGEVSQLLDRPWWRRVWIVQEAVLARKLTISCGPDEAQWDDLNKYFRSVRSRRISSVTCENDFKDVFEVHPFPHSEYLALQQLRTRLRSGNYKGSIYEFLYKFWRFDCTDPRDRIFAFLGLITDIGGTGITPDYSISTAQTFSRLAKTLITGH